MCEQCLAETESWGEPIPGWFLVRATRPGDEMKLGDWGLVWCNDPSYTWSINPRPDIDTDFENRLKASGMAETDIDSEMEKRLNDGAYRDKWTAWMADADIFAEALSKCEPVTSYRLVNGCIGAGYDIENGGYLVYWLFQHLGMWIQHYKPLPHLDHGTPIEPTNPEGEITFDYTKYNEWENQFSHIPWFVSSNAPKGTKASMDYDKAKVYTTVFPNSVS